MKKLVQASALIAGMMTTGAVFAATQGTVGGISTGDITVSVTVTDEVRISSLDDLGGTFGGVDIVDSDQLCVYRNGSGNYNITATGSGGGAFQIANGGTSIPFTVGWNDDTLGGPFTGLTSGTTLVGQNTSETAANDCGAGGGGVDTAEVEVTILATDMLTLPAGAATGLLILTVGPE